MGASVGYQSSKATIVTRGHEGARRGVARTPLQSAASSTLALSAGWAPLRVQRACGCGGGAGLEDESIGRSTMQPSLTVSTPGDSFELEADRVASVVLAGKGEVFVQLRGQNGGFSNGIPGQAVEMHRLRLRISLHGWRTALLSRQTV